MSADEEDYGDFAEEDFIEALSQASQTLPKHRRTSRDSTESSDEEGNGKSKKKKYKIHEGVHEVPKAIILGATQAEGLNPDSSPYRIRGPIFKKPRPEPPKPSKAPIFSAMPNTAPPPKVPQTTPPARNISALSHNDAVAQQLEDLPSDAFSSPSPPSESFSSSLPRQRLVAAQTGLRQTTLFGGRTPDEVPSSQVNKRRNFIKDMPPESPTHHTLDHDAMKTWVYPTNFGAIRDYQFSIVRNGLFHNLLVALPTGLGKTFIAATIMYNYYRWTRNAQIVFVAPTKPLVAQQVDACFNIVGIPRSETTMLTGEQATGLRSEEWQEKRVFFMTPQTLVNDLSSGIADPKKIVLLVVDEAHRATGHYAYVKVVQFLRRFNKSFRILALTATPGASVEAVQEVIDNLEISQVEIRTEESIDIQQFVHRRDIDKILLDPSDEIIMVKDLFAKALQPLVNLLCSQNAYWNKDPMSLNPFILMQARKAWFASPAARQANQGLKGMMMGLFSVLASVAHSIKLLNFHGIGPFYSAIKDFRQAVEDGKGGKYRKQILESPDFRKMMERIQFWLSKDDFVGHPKLTYLCDTILNHFLDAGEGRLPEGAPPSATRVIVFSEFRDSAEDISRILNKHGPMIRASVFVGQADSKRSEGMNQAKQQETISKFQRGVFNVLVATSIGEEGLDIGQVDLIVCYDASGSPIRMLQRMGRTGRKRAGNIVLLLMRGKEEESFMKAKDNYEQMQKMISSGERFAFRHDLSVRIIPRDVKPIVDKRDIEIPFENTQDKSLPEPKKRSAKSKKKPLKKFHMPDGVETGFQTASRIKVEGTDLTDSGIALAPKKVKKVQETELAPIPSLEAALLDSSETAELERRYQHIPGLDVAEVEIPSLTSHPLAQRSLRRTAKVAHGRFTKKSVRLFQILGNSQRREDRHLMPYGDEAPARSWIVPSLVQSEDHAIKRPAPMKKAESSKGKSAAKSTLVLSDLEIDSEIDAPVPRNPREPGTPPLSFSEDGKDGQQSIRKPAKHQRKKKRAKFRSSEGEGDDLEDRETPSEDSDDGESLKDFLAEDEEEPATAATSSSQTVSSPIMHLTPKPYKSSLVRVTQDATQDEDEDDDDDMPEIRHIVGRKMKSPPLALEDGDTDEEGPLAGHRGKRRRVIVDDSDEE